MIVFTLCNKLKKKNFDELYEELVRILDEFGTVYISKITGLQTTSIVKAIRDKNEKLIEEIIKRICGRV